MASSSEVFAKLFIWKKDKTWLDVTVIERGKSEDKLRVRDRLVVSRDDLEWLIFDMK